MKVDYSPRMSGKTTRMIEWLSGNENRVLITFSHEEENRLKRQYPEYSNRIVDFKSYMDAQKSRGSFFSGKNHHLGVDNADIVLERLLGNFVDVGTFSVEPPIELR